MGEELLLLVRGVSARDGLAEQAVEVGSALAGVFPVSTSIEPSLWEAIS